MVFATFWSKETMTDLPIIANDTSNSDEPLPLIVAKRWNFPLAHIKNEDGNFYAVQDWMRGLTGENDTRYLLASLRKQMLDYRCGNQVNVCLM
jgi:hypothetical protein